MVSFAADALKRLVICNRIIRPTSGTIDRSISFSSFPPCFLLLRSLRRPSVYRSPRHRPRVSYGNAGIEKPTRTVCETAAAQDYICPRKIGFLSRNLGTRPSRRVPLLSPSPILSLVHVSARSFYPGTHKDVQDFPRILLRKSPGNASAVRSSEHRRAG